jgi:hypothetical protein
MGSFDWNNYPGRWGENGATFDPLVVGEALEQRRLDDEAEVRQEIAEAAAETEPLLLSVEDAATEPAQRVLGHLVLPPMTMHEPDEGYWYKVDT